MKFGVSTFITDEGLPVTELARALEERGFDSLFVAEHTHIPVDGPIPPDGDLPPHDYYRSLDPFVALTAAAVVTDRLTLGTGIALVVQRDPIALAKEAASLDHVSGGRFQLGVGAGPSHVRWFRCWSVATVRRCWTGCSITVTDGRPTCSVHPRSWWPG